MPETVDSKSKRIAELVYELDERISLRDFMAAAYSPSVLDFVCDVGEDSLILFGDDEIAKTEMSEAFKDKLIELLEGVHNDSTN